MKKICTVCHESGLWLLRRCCLWFLRITFIWIVMGKKNWFYIKSYYFCNLPTEPIILVLSWQIHKGTTLKWGFFKCSSKISFGIEWRVSEYDQLWVIGHNLDYVLCLFNAFHKNRHTYNTKKIYKHMWHKQMLETKMK
jgi:hypothetical protein